MDQLKIYLVGFFFTTMGLLTVMFMAATYGTKELGLDDSVLIPTILLIQLVGMLGAWLFARISGRLGNIRALIISIFIWIAGMRGCIFCHRCRRLCNSGHGCGAGNGWLTVSCPFHLFKNAAGNT